RHRLTNRWPLPDVPDPASLRTLTGHTYRISAVAVAPNGAWLATGRIDSVRICDPATGAVIHALTDRQRPVTSLAAGPDGTRPATSEKDGTVQIWDPRSGRCIRSFTGHTDFITAMAVAPNGTHLATCGRGGDVRIWRSDLAQCAATMRTDDKLHVCSWIPD